MNEYQPTDDQIEALAGVILDPIIPERLNDRPQDKAFWLGMTKLTVESPAFQSIIRAAQAEAWEGGYSSGHWAGIAWARSAAFEKVANPYEESADV